MCACVHVYMCECVNVYMYTCVHVCMCVECSSVTLLHSRADTQDTHTHTHMNATTHGRVVTGGNLWRGPKRRAQGPKRRDLGAGCDGGGCVKVCEQHIARGCDEQVPALDVAVDEVLLVHRSNGSEMGVVCLCLRACECA